MLIKANIKAIGTKTFLFHQLGIGFLSSDRKSLSGQSGNNPEEWKHTVIVEEKTMKLYIPSSYVLASFRGGATYTKAGRGSISKKLVATLQVDPDIIYFDRILPHEKDLKINDNSQSIYIDVRAVKNPMTKGSNLRYRIAMTAGWKFNFSILWDDTIISEQQMRNTARDAGILVGIGDGRSIGCGRYEIAEFRLEKN
jgi:hypothetical protein